MAKDQSRRCNQCSGSDLNFWALNKGDGLCRDCKGSGENNGLDTVFDKLLFPDNRIKCPTCSGTGQCQNCGGTGYEYYSENEENIYANDENDYSVNKNEDYHSNSEYSSYDFIDSTPYGPKKEKPFSIINFFISGLKSLVTGFFVFMGLGLIYVIVDAIFKFGEFTGSVIAITLVIITILSIVYSFKAFYDDFSW